MEGIEEIKKSETYRNATTTIYKLSKSRIVAGQRATIVSSDSDFKTLILENPDIVVPVQDFPITDKHQTIDEGVYDR